MLTFRIARSLDQAIVTDCLFNCTRLSRAIAGISRVHTFQNLHTAYVTLTKERFALSSAHIF